MGFGIRKSNKVAPFVESKNSSLSAQSIDIESQNEKSVQSDRDFCDNFDDDDEGSDQI